MKQFNYYCEVRLFDCTEEEARQAVSDKIKLNIPWVQKISGIEIEPELNYISAINFDSDGDCIVCVEFKYKSEEEENLGELIFTDNDFDTDQYFID